MLEDQQSTIMKVKRGSPRVANVKLKGDNTLQGRGTILCEIEGQISFPATCFYSSRLGGGEHTCLVTLTGAETAIPVNAGQEDEPMSVHFATGDVVGTVTELAEGDWTSDTPTWEWGEERRVEAILQKIEFEDNPLLTPEHKAQIRELVKEYHEIFSLSDKELGLTTLYTHEIKLKEDATIVNKNRPIPMHSFETAKEMIIDMIQMGVLEPSTATYRSPLVIVKKKNGKNRMCIDFRLLNEATVSNLHPLPTVQETRNIWFGCQIWSVMDLSSAFWQIPLHENSRDVTTIWLNSMGSWRHKVVPMGARTSPAALQSLADRLFGDLKANICAVYLDDIISGAATVEVMMENLKLIFERLKIGGLKLKPEKCELFKQEVMFLGCKLNEEGLYANQEKIKDLLQMPDPKSKKDVQRILGLAGYFREFVPKFAEKAKALTALLTGSEKFEFGAEAKSSFDAVKTALSNPPCLVWADPNKTFNLFTDASGYCMGFCLMQEGEDGKMHPIHYGSKMFNPSQLHWPSFVKEFHAAYWAITRMRFYLFGRRFVLHTDCKAMSFGTFLKKTTANAIIRWSMQLSEYEFDIKFIPGKENVVSDFLSRPALPNSSSGLYDYIKQGIEDAVGEQQETKRLEGTVVNQVSEDALPAPVIGDEEFLHESKEDPTFKTVRRWIREEDKVKDPNMLAPQERQYYNKLSRLKIGEQETICIRYGSPGLKEFRWLICVPESQISKVIEASHTVAGAHQSTEKTESRIRQKFYFPNMQEEVRLFCKTCSDCFKTNQYYRKQPVPELKPYTYKYPGMCVNMDVVQVSKGGRYPKVLTMVDKFTKYVVFVPIANEKATTIAKAFLDNYVCIWGPPQILVTDNAAAFKTAEVMNALYGLLGIEKKYCAPYHPQGNGIAERFNKVLLHLLQKLVGDNPGQWREALPRLQLAVNSAINRSTGYSAFRLMTGREMTGLDDIIFETRSTKFYESEHHLANEVYQDLRKIFRLASDNLDLTHRLQKRIYDRNKQAVNLKVGDKVMIYRPKDTSNNYYKLVTNFKGPYIILEAWDQHDFLVQRIQDWRRKTGECKYVVHRNHLRKIPEGMRGNLGEQATETAETIPTVEEEAEPEEDSEIEEMLLMDDDDDDWWDRHRDIKAPEDQRVTRAQARAKQAGPGIVAAGIVPQNHTRDSGISMGGPRTPPNGIYNREPANETPNEGRDHLRDPHPLPRERAGEGTPIIDNSGNARSEGSTQISTPWRTRILAEITRAFEEEFGEQEGEEPEINEPSRREDDLRREHEGELATARVVEPRERLVRYTEAPREVMGQYQLQRGPSPGRENTQLGNTPRPGELQQDITNRDIWTTAILALSESLRQEKEPKTATQPPERQVEVAGVTNMSQRQRPFPERTEPQRTESIRNESEQRTAQTTIEGPGVNNGRPGRETLEARQGMLERMSERPGTAAGTLERQPLRSSYPYQLPHQQLGNPEPLNRITRTSPLNKTVSREDGGKATGRKEDGDSIWTSPPIAPGRSASEYTETDRRREEELLRMGLGIPTNIFPGTPQARQQWLAKFKEMKGGRRLDMGVPDKQSTPGRGPKGKEKKGHIQWEETPPRIKPARPRVQHESLRDEMEWEQLNSRARADNTVYRERTGEQSDNTLDPTPPLPGYNPDDSFGEYEQAPLGVEGPDWLQIQEIAQRLNDLGRETELRGVESGQAEDRLEEERRQEKRNREEEHDETRQPSPPPRRSKRNIDKPRPNYRV
eukprot:sb/3460695/